MKILLLILFQIFFTSGFALAQKGANHQKIEDAKRVYLAEKLALTKQESTQFWPIYAEYNSEKKSLMQLYKHYKTSLKDSAVSETESRTLLNKILDIKQQELNLEKKYVEKYYTVLPANKVGKVVIAEREFFKVLYKNAACKKEGNMH